MQEISTLLFVALGVMLGAVLQHIIPTYIYLKRSNAELKKKIAANNEELRILSDEYNQRFSEEAKQYTVEAIFKYFSCGNADAPSHADNTNDTDTSPGLINSDSRSADIRGD